MFRLNKLVIGYQRVKISSVSKTLYKSEKLKIIYDYRLLAFIARAAN